MLTLILGLMVGFYARELRDSLRRVESRLKTLLQRRQDVDKPQKTGMSFGDVASAEDLKEMSDEDLIRSLNEM